MTLSKFKKLPQPELLPQLELSQPEFPPTELLSMIRHET